MEMYQIEIKDRKPEVSLEDHDVWAIQDLVEDQVSVPWGALDTKGKILRIFIGIAKCIGLLTLLYFFVCSLDLLSLGFRLVGGRTTGEIFRQSDIIKNPVVGLMMGVLTTVLVQSSSTSTSIIVSLVSASFIDVSNAIPIIFGANIGTSVTSTIVSLTQAGDRAQFRRAFAGATVHDMFNWLSVIVLLTIEIITGVLFKLTDAIMEGVSPSNSSGGGEIEILGKITKPFVKNIIQLDKKVLECWATPDKDGCLEKQNSSLVKEFCDGKPCKFLFAGSGMSDAAVGAIVLFSSLFVLCTCLILIVKILNSVLKGHIAKIIKKTLNANIPYIPWITGYIAIFVGAIVTFLVQSSSVFTSALTPLVGLGVITIERAYPLTLGSNIGTTTTALIASLAVTGDKFRPSMQIALCHLFFNIFGILLFYPIPFMRFPIGLAKFLGETTAKYRWFAIAYMLMMFVILPVIIMGLSFAGMPFVIAFAVLVGILIVLVTFVNFVKVRWPNVLPNFLLNWKFLPRPLRSLEPYDEIFTKFKFCRKLKEKGEVTINSDPETRTRSRVSISSISRRETNSNSNSFRNMNGNSSGNTKGNVNPAFVHE